MNARPDSLRIALVTDAWLPQTNGVVKTLGQTVAQLRALGHDVLIIEPRQFRNFPCPSYPEIQVAWMPGHAVAQMLDRFAPHVVHIATEGTLGVAGRRWCVRRGVAFTTSYHTQFPEYVRARYPIPLTVGYAVLRAFHGAATRTMVATPSMQRRLESRGFKNIVRWTRGVDVELFKPGPKSFLDLPRPIFMYFGRVAIEKNIESFLALDLPGTKVVVGDGPARTPLQAAFPHALFTGYKFGEELACHIAAADVSVFPSLTDTFGLVLLEAMACGVPIAAFPVTGPIDVVKQGVTGFLDDDLRMAALNALHIDPLACRAYAVEHTWARATEQFLGNLAINEVTLPHCRASTTILRTPVRDSR